MYLEFCFQFSKLQDINIFQQILIGFLQPFHNHWFTGLLTLCVLAKCYSILKETISSNESTKVCGEIKMETELLSSSISKRHKRKYKRDNITVFSHQRKNRRFRKSKRIESKSFLSQAKTHKCFPVTRRYQCRCYQCPLV